MPDWKVTAVKKAPKKCALLVLYALLRSCSCEYSIMEKLRDDKKSVHYFCCMYALLRSCSCEYHGKTTR
jgi:hypothetical protein